MAHPRNSIAIECKSWQLLSHLLHVGVLLWLVVCILGAESAEGCHRSSPPLAHLSGRCMGTVPVFGGRRQMHVHFQADAWVQGLCLVDTGAS